MNIRPVTPEDRYVVQKLLRSEPKLWPNAGNRMWYHYWNYRRRNQYMVVAELDGRVVGFAHWLITVNRTRSVSDLVVSPEFRRRGIGTALLQYIGSPLKCKGRLHVFPTSTRPQRPWILTHSGQHLDVFDLKSDDIRIEDIAHALACINRFNGHLAKPVSVAQHSVSVSKLCEGTGYELEGLLHDASEAYLGDVTKWLKQTEAFAGYREAEGRIQRLIFDKFGIEYPCDEAELLSAEVQEADWMMVRFEAERGYGQSWQSWSEYPPITDEERTRIGEWRPWSWREAERRFLQHFGIVFGRHRTKKRLAS